MKLIISICILLYISCSINSQEGYDRNLIFERFNSELNGSIPDFKIIIEGGFKTTDDGVPVGYTVYDLNDPNNFSKKIPDDSINNIVFKEGHFYHFSPVIMSLSFSHIAYLEKGNIIIFKSVNCLDKGDSFKDVLSYANEKLKNNPKKEDIMNRLKNYRQYGDYHIEDNYGMKINCKCSPCG